MQMQDADLSSLLQLLQDADIGDLYDLNDLLAGQIGLPELPSQVDLIKAGIKQPITFSGLIKLGRANSLKTENAL
jgi:hypothetical protein